MSERLISRRGFTLLAASSAAATALLRARAARADGPVSATVLVMHARQVDGGGAIDPEVGDLPQLKKPPFSAYNSIKLLEKKVFSLEKGKPVTHSLMTGRTLQVSLLEVTADKRFHVGAAINQPGGAAFLKLLEVKAAPNEPFFVAGQSYKDGTVVLAFTINKT